MKQKFIIGDVVMYDNKVMVVKELRDGIHFDLSCPKEGFVYCYVGVDEIKPISLTPEILEKNGWRKEQENYFNDSYHIFLETEYEKYSAFKVVHNNVVWLRDVRNVSDLQHLLFGLGLNSEMEL